MQHKLQNIFVLIPRCICSNCNMYLSKTGSSLSTVTSRVRGAQISPGGWNVNAARGQQPLWRNPPTTPLASRSLHHLSVWGGGDHNFSCCISQIWSTVFLNISSSILEKLNLSLWGEAEDTLCLSNIDSDGGKGQGC